MKHDSDYCNKRTLIFVESYDEIKRCLFITKRFIKERLIQRAYSKILFPQTMTEFENIFKNV